RHPRDHMGAIHMWSTVGPRWNCFLQHQSPNTIQSGPSPIYARCISLKVPINTAQNEPLDRSFSYASKMQLCNQRKKQASQREHAA
ncbi:hypothetical protein SETIT_4G169800v2, partial [Setaria italica]